MNEQNKTGENLSPEGKPEKKPMSRAEKISAWLTAAIFVATAASAIIFYFQYREMQSASEQTSQIITKSGEQVTATNSLATEAGKQAKQNERSADAAKKQAAAQEGQLALAKQGFDIEHGAPLRFEPSLWQLGRGEPKGVAVIRFQTFGNRSAKFIVLYASLEFRRSKPPNVYPADRPPANLQPCGTIDPATCTQANLEATLSPKTYSDYVALRINLYAWGYINYLDERGTSQVFHFCQYVSAKDVTEASYPVPKNVFMAGFHDCK